MKITKLLIKIICIGLLSTQQFNAQWIVTQDTIPGQHTQYYDTMVVFRPSFIDTCQMDYNLIPYNQYGSCIDITNQDYVNNWQNETNPLKFDENGNVINIPLTIDDGIFCSNNYRPECFAQYWHFDSAVYICGVAARICGYSHGKQDHNYFRLFDTNFHEIRESINTIDVSSIDNLNAPLYRYSFINDWDSIPRLQDFYIAGDESTQGGAYVYYSHSCSIFDTIWKDTTIGCQMPYPPYFKKDGIWKSFADDTIYQFYQKCFIELLPVLLINRYDTIDRNSLADDIFEQNSWIFPNPTNDEINIQSEFKIKNIELSNIEGKVIIRKNINNNETKLNISSLKQGYYILKLFTDRGGYCNKTIIKE